MTAFLTSLPPTPSSIAMPVEFSDVTEVTGSRRNSISTRPTTQSVSTKQVNTKDEKAVQHVPSGRDTGENDDASAATDDCST